MAASVPTLVCLNTVLTFIKNMPRHMHSSHFSEHMYPQHQPDDLWHQWILHNNNPFEFIRNLNDKDKQFILNIVETSTKRQQTS